FFFQAEDGIRDGHVTGVQTCALPILRRKVRFSSSGSFNTFYHDYRVLDEPEEEKRTFLLWMTDYFRSQLENTLEVLGISVPAYRSEERRVGKETSSSGTPAVAKRQIV